MIAGFERYDSTKIGRIAERVVRAYYIYVLTGYTISKDLDEEYDTSRDIDFNYDSKTEKHEIKGSTYKSPNFPIENQQQNRKGHMVDSAIRITQAEYMNVYCFDNDTIYKFKVETFNYYISQGYIDESMNKPCNKDSETGETMCYLIHAGNFEDDGFFSEVYRNVLCSLDKAGVSRQSLGIQGVENTE